MTGKEWIEIFKEINGRVPSPQEYQEAIKNGEIEAAKPVATTPVKPEPIEEVVKEEPVPVNPDPVEPVQVETTPVQSTRNKKSNGVFKEFMKNNGTVLLIIAMLLGLFGVVAYHEMNSKVEGSDVVTLASYIKGYDYDSNENIFLYFVGNEDVTKDSGVYTVLYYDNWDWIRYNTNSETLKLGDLLALDESERLELVEKNHQEYYSKTIDSMLTDLKEMAKDSDRESDQNLLELLQGDVENLEGYYGDEVSLHFNIMTKDDKTEIEQFSTDNSTRLELFKSLDNYYTKYNLIGDFVEVSYQTIDGQYASIFKDKGDDPHHLVVFEEEPIKFDTIEYHDDSVTIDEDIWEY